MLPLPLVNERGTTKMPVVSPRGTADILPTEVGRWLEVEDAARRIARLYGFEELRTPIFEHTELFTRGVGEATDIVQKEMYTFIDKGDRSITLRPEGTAPIVRSYLEHKLSAWPKPVKFFYIGPMFRYERPQAGRMRQFHQFGVEAFGSEDARLDAEVIDAGARFYRELGITDLRLLLNSIGCPECRPRYVEALSAYLRSRADELCRTCRDRLERNPLRVLDCKEEGCGNVLSAAPVLDQNLCDGCWSHFETVKRLLGEIGISFEIAPRLVRGLDYYTRTVFEFVSDAVGAQDSLGGGGRYDGLVEKIGGDQTPGIGFAVGVERILLALEKLRPTEPARWRPAVFVATAGGGIVRDRGFALLTEIRNQGVPADMDHAGRGLKSQMKQADRLGASFVVIVGEEELGRGVATLRRLASGEQEEVGLAEAPRRLSELTKAEAL